MKCTYALQGSLLDCGIDLPQERDMAVRLIDVPAAGRARDRGGSNRYQLWTVEAAFGIPATLSPVRQNDIKWKTAYNRGANTTSRILGGATQGPQWGAGLGLASARLS